MLTVGSGCFCAASPLSPSDVEKLVAVLLVSAAAFSSLEMAEVAPVVGARLAASELAAAPLLPSSAPD
eukprot:877202-Pyramimonas_sp.AAC.1